MKNTRLTFAVRKNGLKRFFPASIQWIRLAERKAECRQAYALHADEISHVEDMLEDDLSKKTLRAYMELTTHHNANPLKRVTRPANKQYFDDCITPMEDAVFVDMGVLDGATSLQFAQWAGEKYKGVILFEPDEVSYKRSKKNVSGLANVIMYNEGASDVCGKMYFSGTGGGGSRIIDDATGFEITVATLDSKIPEIPIPGGGYILKWILKGRKWPHCVAARKRSKILRPLLLSVYTIGLRIFGKSLCWSNNSTPITSCT